MCCDVQRRHSSGAPGRSSLLPTPEFYHEQADEFCIKQLVSLLDTVPESTCPTTQHNNKFIFRSSGPGGLPPYLQFLVERCRFGRAAAPVHRALVENLQAIWMECWRNLVRLYYNINRIITYILVVDKCHRTAAPPPSGICLLYGREVDGCRVPGSRCRRCPAPPSRHHALGRARGLPPPSGAAAAMGRRAGLQIRQGRQQDTIGAVTIQDTGREEKMHVSTSL